MTRHFTRVAFAARALRRVSILALAAAMMQLVPALADITNTVTATGSSPGGSNDVTATGNATVKVQLAAPALSMTKTPTFTDAGAPGAAAADVITYTYDVTNSGNTYLKNVSVSDLMTGASGTMSAITLATPAVTHTNANTLSSDNGTDAVYDLLAPGDVVHFTATYTVTAQDIQTYGAGTGHIANTATAGAVFDNGTTTVPESTTASASVALEAANAMTVVKSASPSTGVKAGDSVTYTYVVTNTGTSNISGIHLVDSHNASGPAPQPGGETLDSPNSGNSQDASVNGTYDLLAPGDSVTFTATYVVTQQDVDTLQ